MGWLRTSSLTQFNSFVLYVAGHTKFAPDKLVASIAKKFLQFWCVLYQNVGPYTYSPAVYHQSHLHTQADEAVEKIPGTEIFHYSQKLLQRMTSLWSHERFLSEGYNNFNDEYTPLIVQL